MVQFGARLFQKHLAVRLWPSLKQWRAKGDRREASAPLRMAV
jgi:hypothetical protein